MAIFNWNRRRTKNQMLLEGRAVSAEARALELTQENQTLRTQLEAVREQLNYERTDGHKKYFDDRYKNLFIYLADTSLARSRLKNLISLFTPHEVHGFQKIRLGRAHDGGYVCLDDFDVDAVLSLGISDDVSWDLDALTHGSFQIHQYDYTVDGPPVHNPRFTFYKEAIGTGSGAVSLAEACDRANVLSPASAILKIDIEHAEWPVFAATPDKIIGNFSQIIGEFHGFDEVLNDQWYEEALETFTKISKQFKLVHVHGNNCGSQIVLGSRLLPRTLEMTFANITRYDLSPSDETFPTPLDMPNSPDKPDHMLDNFAL
jgi:hypothetical protein